jgi:hypothetical protein
MGLKLEKGLELFFQKKWKQISSLILSFLGFSFTFDAQRTFAALQFARPMTQKLLNLVKEWGKHWKVVGDMYMFGDG